MTPRSKSDDSNLERKKDYFNNMIMTSHNPHTVTRVPQIHQVYARGYEQYKPQYDLVPNQTVLKLAGF